MANRLIRDIMAAPAAHIVSTMILFNDNETGARRGLSHCPPEDALFVISSAIDYRRIHFIINPDSLPRSVFIEN